MDPVTAIGTDFSSSRASGLSDTDVGFYAARMRFSVLAARPSADAPLGELIDNCLSLTITAPRLCRDHRPPQLRTPVIDDRTLALLDGYPEYGG